jgi:hypothetical protein
MISPEVFYLHIQGEQRGPYTIKHIDHLLNSGLIAEETLFWREGLEQWQPVTNLVVRREHHKNWRPWIIGGAVAVALALLLWMFGPITAQGWRESNQHQFTSEAAYWRARDVVRHSALPKGAVVSFNPVDQAQVTLQHGASGASVLLRGELFERGGRTRPAAWRVELKYDAAIAEWAGVNAAEVPVP